MLRAVQAVAQSRAIAFEIVQFDVGRLPHDRPVAGETRGDQVARALALAIDGDGLAREAREIDAEAPAVDGQFDAFMHQPLAMQSFGDTGLLEQPHRSLFEHARAHAGFDIGPGAGFEDHAVDPVGLQQPGEQETGRPRANNADLRPLLARHLLPTPCLFDARPGSGYRSRLA